MMNPTVLVLKEGTDTSQGIPQLISNINACSEVVNIVATTLGPRGMDKLIQSKTGETTISNDGATILGLLEIVHPAARTLVDIARAQDAEVGDGTTSVVLLAGELLKESKSFLEEGISPHMIIRGFRSCAREVVKYIRDIAVKVDLENPETVRETLLKVASTALTSKMITSQRPFFASMVVDAMLSLDPVDLDESLIGIKKVPGGALQDSQLIKGVAFKKTFSYAGFEQQPKTFKNPKILCLNIELELKAERDNAEVRVEQVSEYQAIVDAEWKIIYDKLDAIVATGAQVVLSRLPIGDLATQYFADRNIFCAGRVAHDDLKRVIMTAGGEIQSTVSDIRPVHLGECAFFEERQVGSERYNIFEGGLRARSATIILRGGAQEFISEVERSLHDALMIVKRSLRNSFVVAGGGAIEMELSKFLRSKALSIEGKQQLIMGAFAKSLEVIPRQICNNAGIDATDLLSSLRMEHSKGQMWQGVDVETESSADNMKNFVWEPALVKINAIQSAAEAACLLLSIDETITASEAKKGPPARGGRSIRGRPM